MKLSPGTQQDRFHMKWEPDFPRAGHRHTLDIETDGRAGAAGGLRSVAIEGASITDGQVSHDTERT